MEPDQPSPKAERLAPGPVSALLRFGERCVRGLVVEVVGVDNGR